nr:DUF2400 family protein [Candidatus Brachybacter algidus]
MTAFWTAMLAWGRRATIINKATELIDLMDGSPYDFILNHTEQDRVKFLSLNTGLFRQMTLFIFCIFFRIITKNWSLRSAFCP